MGKKRIGIGKAEAKNFTENLRTVVKNPKTAILPLLISTAVLQSCGGKDDDLPEPIDPNPNPVENTDAPVWSGEFTKKFTETAVGESMAFKVEDSDGISELIGFKERLPEDLLPVFDTYFDIRESKHAKGINCTLTLKKAFDYFDPDVQALFAELGNIQLTATDNYTPVEEAKTTENDFNLEPENTVSTLAEAFEATETLFAQEQNGENIDQTMLLGKTVAEWKTDWGQLGGSGVWENTPFEQLLVDQANGLEIRYDEVLETNEIYFGDQTFHPQIINVTSQFFEDQIMEANYDGTEHPNFRNSITFDENSVMIPFYKFLAENFYNKEDNPYQIADVLTSETTAETYRPYWHNGWVIMPYLGTMQQALIKRKNSQELTPIEEELVKVSDETYDRFLANTGG